ncbi:hypothetical protein KI387_009782 [Taxus chinensis]|uniref:Uncharacterized protein n=1 Tax=Taxus chinensis TaxID=29808 RepID=A0AA38FKR8_TAXCH|nr:hypothetical protein KI387_009782 [Taxus chinensis]
MADEKPKMKMKNKNKERESPADSDLLKPSNVNVNVKVKVKKEAESVKDNSNTCTSPPVKMKGTLRSSAEKEKEKEKGQGHDKKQRKLYALPGQKRDPPEERDPLRIFYETLHEQRPMSEMAEFWMMEHGLLSPEKASKAFEKKQKKQHQLKVVGSPMKSPSVKKINQNLEKSSAKDISKVSSKSKKKRAHLSDSDSDELIMPKKRLRMSS